MERKLAGREGHPEDDVLEHGQGNGSGSNHVRDVPRDFLCGPASIVRRFATRDADLRNREDSRASVIRMRSAVLAGLLMVPLPLEAQDTSTLPLSIAIATLDGQPVVSSTWLDEEVGNANRLFLAHGICFRVVRTRSLDPEQAPPALETRADRHSLGRLLEDWVINVFVVGSLRDVDDPSLLRMGVHWRPRGRPGKHFVILSADAMPTTLAHELGHFFGNPHTRTAGNLMSYLGRGPGSTFDERQGRRIRSHARRFLRTGELRVPAGATCDP